MHRDIYFLGIDTNAEDLKKLKADLNRDSRSIMPAWVDTIQTSANYQMLAPVIHRDIVEPYGDGVNDAALDRIKQHWWFDQNGNPATAPRVYPLFKGAGQQPAVSHYLTWKHMPLLTEIVSILVREIINRRSGPHVERPPLHHLSILVATGLAGGTGRGAWKLVTAKLKDAVNNALDDERQAVNPVCFFLDASCYPNVYQQSRSTENKLRVNSLTGISEISVWLGHERDSGDPFRLPSLDNPGNEDSDLIQLNPVLGEGPLYNAMFAFGRNDMAVIGKSEDAFEMVASSIYGLISHGAIQDEQINNGGDPFWGVGSAAFEVPIEDLKTFFEEDARAHACSQLIGCNEEEVSMKVDRFIQDHGWILNPDELIDEDPPDWNQQMLLGRFRHYYEEAFSEKLEALQAVLKRQDMEGALQAVSAFEDVDITEEKVQLALDKALASLLRDEDETLKDAVLSRAFTGSDSVYMEDESLDAADLFLDFVVSGLENAVIAFDSEGLPPLSDDIDPREEIKIASKKEIMGVFGPRFNDAEIQRIDYEARIALMHRSEKLLVKCLGKVVEELSQASQPLQTAFSESARILKRIRQNYLKQANRLEEDGGLFTDEGNAEETIAISEKRFQLRKLRPRRPDAEQYRDLVDLQDLLIKLREQISRSSKSGGPTDRTERLREEAEFEEIINREVGIQAALLEEFTVEKVVAGLRRFWLNYLDERRNSRKFNRLASNFHQFFGVRVVLNPTEGSGVEFKDDHNDGGFLCRMGSSLVTVCRPYWLADEKDDAVGAKVLLFMPTAIPDSEADGWSDRIMSGVGQDLRVQPTIYGLRAIADEDGERHVEGNPYMMLAYSDAAVESLDDIKSLNYWRGNSKLQTLLDMAESPHGESLFGKVGDDLGVGYPDPSYVRRPVYCDRRWKPWAQGKKEEQRRRDQAIEALLHGFFTPSENISAKLAERNWEQPLLELQDRQWIVFRRRPYDHFGVNEGAIVKPFSAWSNGDKMEQSVRRVYDLLLNGSGENSEKAAKWRSEILDDRELLWKTAAMHLGFGPGTVEFVDSWQRTAAFCDQQFSEANDEADRQVWRELGERANKHARTGEL